MLMEVLLVFVENFSNRQTTFLAITAISLVSLNLM